MNKYKLGKDMGGLMERVKVLENVKKPCGCSGSNTNIKNQRGVSDNLLFESLKNASPNEETYEILKRLVTDAGNVTIRELFACSSDDVGATASNAIVMSKKIGFLALSNNKCCHEVNDVSKDDYCKDMEGKWCSLVKATIKYRCTLASDSC